MINDEDDGDFLRDKIFSSTNSEDNNSKLLNRLGIKLFNMYRIQNNGNLNNKKINDFKNYIFNNKTP